MIRAYLCLYNRHLFPFAQLPQYFPDFPAFLTEEHLAPIFRREYDVIFAVPFRSVYKELHADRETGC